MATILPLTVAAFATYKAPIEAGVGLGTGFILGNISVVSALRSEVDKIWNDCIVPVQIAITIILAVVTYYVPAASSVILAMHLGGHVRQYIAPGSSTKSTSS